MWNPPRLAEARRSVTDPTAMNDVLLNAAYLLMLAAFVARDALWMRLLLVLSQLSFIGYALFADNFSMTVWNAGFVAVNLVQTCRIFRKRRPIALSPVLEAIYLSAFAVMRRREFLYLWFMGRDGEATNRALLEHARPEGTLFFITEGAVAIFRDGREVAGIGPGDFIADASAVFGSSSPGVDARAVGRARYRCWDKDALERLRLAAPEIYIKVQKLLGSYMAGKLRQALDG
ncbi:MAG TPA: cyclic nucleotide-binding domain-containing protein [bacterium]|nr:cyclic nucleotide-binding domain-containing protein [bacterium]HPJ71173.1 cyclic nucleotide-binding domain-containing protein [bacterium]HPQ65899.1 cyclic nucleotide-binding domain-containing protein [bacterium]